MLRAAKKLFIDSPSFQSNNGFLLSPVIDINGLVLRADRTMEQQKPIKEFLESKGMVVSRVEVDKEFYIAISGECFYLTMLEIKEFLQQNKDLIASQNQDLEQTPVANNMRKDFISICQNTIGGDLSSYITSNSDIGILFNEVTTDLGPISDEPIYAGKKMLAGQDITIIGDEIERSGSEMLAGRDIKVLVTKITCSGQGVPKPLDIKETKVGLMDLQLALNDLNLVFGQVSQLDNVLIGAGNNIMIRGTFQLNIDPEVDWLNNPYGYLPMFKDKAKEPKFEKCTGVNKTDDNNSSKDVVEHKVHRTRRASECVLS